MNMTVHSNVGILARTHTHMHSNDKHFFRLYNELTEAIGRNAMLTRGLFRWRMLTCLQKLLYAVMVSRTVCQVHLPCSKMKLCLYVLFV